MSGGRLVVLNRDGVEQKSYALAQGQATLGSDLACNIRIVLCNVSPHHATVEVHTRQALVHSVWPYETLVNGVPIRMAALRHNDVINVGGKELRWEYSEPHLHHNISTESHTVVVSEVRGRSRARGRRSEPVPSNPIQYPHRSSIPASQSKKQIAVVQPQRRDMSAGNHSKIPVPTTRRQDLQENTQVTSSQDTATRKVPRQNPKSPQASTTKATLWIESRKSRPPLTPTPRVTITRATLTPKRTSRIASKLPEARLVLTPFDQKASNPPKNTQSTQKLPRARTLTPQASSVTPFDQKPSNPPKTTQSAQKLPLRARTLTPRAQASYVTPLRARPNTSLRQTVLRRKIQNKPVKIEAPTSIDHTKQAAIMLMTRHTKSKSPNVSAESLKTIETNKRTSRTPKRSVSQTSFKSTGKRNSSVLDVSESILSGRRSSSCPSLKKSSIKSALKDPQSMRKTESIKFDLSNLENQSRISDVIMIDSTNPTFESLSNTTRFSESESKSPSKRSISSRSSRILEKTLGSSMSQIVPSETSAVTISPPRSPYHNTTSSSPRLRTSRSSIIVQKAIEKSTTSRNSKSLSDSYRTLVNAEGSLSPNGANMETYSIVDLVFMDSSTGDKTVDSTPFGTPQSNRRRTRFTDPTLTSSTPYQRTTHNSSLSESRVSVGSSPMVTPENSENSKPVLSTRKSRASRSRSRISESEILFLEDEDSPRTSKRLSKSSASPFVPKSLSANLSSNRDETATPEIDTDNDRASTPVLSIQNLLNSSRGSSQKSVKKSKRKKRKTIGAITYSKRKRNSARSKSLNLINTQEGSKEGTVTPTGTVPLLPEGVKNKHSTAKKTQSKRSMIDDLNESDIVKELFSSPVKRKLSRSMTEFSRHLAEDDTPVKKTRHTIAVPDGDSFVEQSRVITPDLFVSPIDATSNSPNMSGIKRLFRKGTPKNDLTDLRGVKSLLRTPRTRKSLANDLINVSGVKRVFGKSPRNRLSDVRVKDLFAKEPENDLRRVSAVKTIFKGAKKQKSPRNSLGDVRGVKNLYRRSPRNELNVSGVKDALTIRSPVNDLTDVRGLRRMYRLEKEKFQSNLSGINELFNDNNSLDNSFDLLMGRPPLRTYSKASSAQKSKPKAKSRAVKSLYDSIQGAVDVEKWVKERKPVQTYSAHTLPIKKRSLTKRSFNDSKVTLPLKKRAISTPVKKGYDTLSTSDFHRVSPITSRCHDDDLTGILQIPDVSIQEDLTNLTKKNDKSEHTTNNTMSASQRVTRSVLKTSASGTRNISKILESPNEATTSTQTKNASKRNRKADDVQSQNVASSSQTQQKDLSQEVPANTRSSRRKITIKTSTPIKVVIKKPQGPKSKATAADEVVVLQPDPVIPPASVKKTRSRVKELQKSEINEGKSTPDSLKPVRKTRARKSNGPPVVVKTSAKNPRTSLVISKPIPVSQPASAKKTRSRAKLQTTQEDPEPIKDIAKKQTKSPKTKATQQKLVKAAVVNPRQTRKRGGPSESPVKQPTRKKISFTVPVKTPVKAVKKTVKIAENKANKSESPKTSSRSTRQRPKPLTPKVKVVQKGTTSTSSDSESKAKKPRGAKAEKPEPKTSAKTKQVEVKPQRGRKTPVESAVENAPKRTKRNTTEAPKPTAKAETKEAKKESPKTRGKAKKDTSDVAKPKTTAKKSNPQETENAGKRTRGKNASQEVPSTSKVDKTAEAKTTKKAQNAKTQAPARTTRKRKSVDVPPENDKQEVSAKRRKAADGASAAPARTTRAKVAEAARSTRSRKR